ncbi:hypothetical protein NIES4071_100680 [Calothrix sp. NIES-4071]|nr:hypothetical protein NIES4071_100680 [Calothrix sp. NIES-4071]BAZ64328.1 hypothetical protein NIES4105_100610 [Calothrix sp. NIES-4105]
MIESSTINTVGSILALVDSVLLLASKNGTGLCLAVRPWNISIISNTSAIGIILPSPNTVAPATPIGFGAGPSNCLITISCSLNTVSTCNPINVDAERITTTDTISSSRPPYTLPRLN